MNTGESTDSMEPEGDYLNPAFLSNIAVFVKDQVPRGLRVKGAVEYPQSFTGDEVVVSLQNFARVAQADALCRQSTIQRALSFAPNGDRKYALSVARSLHQSLWFHEVSITPPSDASARADLLLTGRSTGQMRYSRMG